MTECFSNHPPDVIFGFVDLHKTFLRLNAFSFCHMSNFYQARWPCCCYLYLSCARAKNSKLVLYDRCDECLNKSIAKIAQQCLCGSRVSQEACMHSTEGMNVLFWTLEKVLLMESPQHMSSCRLCCLHRLVVFPQTKGFILEFSPKL